MVMMDEGRRKNLARFGRQFFWYILFVLANLLLNRLVGVVGLPLYIDNVGTIIAAAFGGSDDIVLQSLVC